LVEVGFPTVERWTSMSTLPWGGHTWTARALSVEGLQVQPLRVSGTLVLGNLDGVAGALVLTHGVQDRPITLYGYDAAATGAADVVWQAAAVGGAAQVGPREVRIALRHRTEHQMSPRTYVGQTAGFQQLLPDGTVLRINGQTIKLERRS
ncbi:MAG: hypothetical protein LCH89_20880, partial [Proteobacteria bacterium]|nr:hypothetical protein [Pseudomonadota bacterium]